MTLLETVTKLREMEQDYKQSPVAFGYRWAYHTTENASAMLDVLRHFQGGDANLLGDLIYIEEDSAKFQAGFGKIAPEMQKIIDMLNRLQEGARRMEE